MTPSEKIDNLIASLNDWRGPMLKRIREIFHGADPDIVEDWKYMGTPTFYHDGMIAIADAYKSSIKIGFLYGARLPDPHKVFNNELAGNQRRAIKLFEGDKLNEKALKGLIKSAIKYNQSNKSKI
jgi:hypothetical protein